MNRMLHLLVFVLSVTAFLGCDKPWNPSVEDFPLAPMLTEPKPWNIVTPKLSTREIGKVDKSGPHIEIKIHILSKRHNLPLVELPAGKNYQVLPKGQFEKNYVLYCHSSPPTPWPAGLMIIPGQEGSIVKPWKTVWITDWAYKPKVQAGELPFRHVVSEIQSGVVMVVSARIESGEVVLTKIHAQTSSLYDYRRCTGVVRAKGEDWTLMWNEPIVLVDECRINNGCKIPLKPGQHLLVPLAQGFQQCPPATVRLLVKGDAVTSEASVSSGREEVLAHNPFVLVISARIVLPEEKKQDAKPADK